VREYQEGFPKFFVLSFLAFVAYLAGGWALWRFLDRGETPPIAEGEQYNGFVRTQVGEEDVNPHSWSRWYEAPLRGVSVQLEPPQAEKIARIEARRENGSTEQIDGRFGKRDISSQIVAARIWNGASSRVLARFFIWRPTQFREGDIDKGERLEKVATLSLQPDEWSDWVVQPDGTSEVIVQMDSYAEAVVKCGLRLDDGTMQVVPAVDRWVGQKVHGVRLRNDGANPVTATVLAWRPLQQPVAMGSGSPPPAPSQSSSAEASLISTDDVPLPDTAEQPPGAGWRPTKLLTVVLSQWQDSEWVDRPAGCWGVIPVCSDPTRFMGQFYLADGRYSETYNPKYHLKQEAARARTQNVGYGKPVRYTFYTWCR
jgi:hypothetical protein